MAGELREQIELMSKLLNEAPTMIWVKDYEGNILWCNEGGARAGGTTRAKMEGSHQDDWWPLEWTRKWILDDREVMNAGHAKRNIIETLTHPKTGAVRWVRSDKVPLLDGSGNAVGVAVYSVDVTDLMDPNLTGFGRPS